MLTKDETFYVYNTSLVFILLFPLIFELKVNINDIFVITKFYKYQNGQCRRLIKLYILFIIFFLDILSPAYTNNKPLVMAFWWLKHTILKKMIWEKTCFKHCATWNEIFSVPSGTFDCFKVNTHFYTWILRLNNTTTRFATFITSTNSPFVIAQWYIMKGNVLSLFLSKYRKFLWSEMDWTLIGIVDECNMNLWYW